MIWLLIFSIVLGILNLVFLIMLCNFVVGGHAESKQMMENILVEFGRYRNAVERYLKGLMG